MSQQWNLHGLSAVKDLPAVCLVSTTVGAAVVSVRHAGGIHVFNPLNYFFSISGMIIPGSSYWNVGIGRTPGEVKGDAEGVQTMKS